jgi:hypothetical protein
VTKAAPAIGPLITLQFKSVPSSTAVVASSSAADSKCPASFSSFPLDDQMAGAFAAAIRRA